MWPKTRCAGCKKEKENYLFSPGQLKLSSSRCIKCIAEVNRKGIRYAKAPLSKEQHRDDYTEIKKFKGRRRY